MNGREPAMRSELKTIQPIAHDGRHGRTRPREVGAGKLLPQA
jgi:hypothetical protein